MEEITPQNVHSNLRRHMLVDGHDLVFDLKRSQGSYIYDSRRGRKFLDFFTFFASSPIGYNHPKLTSREFQEKLAYVAVNKVTNSDFYTVELAEFVDTFSRVAIPKYLPHLFLISGGALAVENALKTAFDWKVRKNFAKGYKAERGHQVIYFQEAFHGRTGYTLSLTNTSDPRKTMYYPKFKWSKVLNPKVTFPLKGENLREVERAEEVSLSQIRQAIARNREDIAAIIIEPIQGEGGDNHFRGEFLKTLKEIADEEELFLILDEIQTGVGLTGKMWAHQHFSLEPDIICFGKKSQVCGILCGPKVDEIGRNVFQESTRLNSTFGGNIVDMVRFQRYLEVIEEENLVENACKMGDYLLSKLEEIQKAFTQKVSNARGRGLMIAFDLTDPEARDRLKERIYENGMVVSGCGERTIRFRPPLNISRDEVDEGMTILKKSLEQV
jgi:L-lysine 6-transaminase